MDMIAGDNLTAIDVVISEGSITVGILACGRNLQSAEKLGDYLVSVPEEWRDKLLHQVKANVELRIIGYGQI
jgi:hypothetical protein